MKARKPYCVAIYYLIAVVRIVLAEIGCTPVDLEFAQIRSAPFAVFSISRQHFHYSLPSLLCL